MRFPMSLALAALAACDPAPVAWSEPVRLDAKSVAAAGPHWRLVLGAQGAPRAEKPAFPVRAYTPAMCPGSGVAARTKGREWYAAWWTSRADSSATLLVARTTDDGATWSPALVADARDQGRRGCARPAPAIAADSATGYVHLAYFLEPAEGAGVWLIHSMERGAMWHPPVAIAFGPDPAAASVAVLGDTVAVAFESPNGREGWIGLAISNSDGHLIDHALPAVSGRSIEVVAPRVALLGRWIAVAWVTQRGGLTFARAGIRR